MYCEGCVIICGYLWAQSILKKKQRLEIKLSIILRKIKSLTVSFSAC